ncbi:hypothetical protein [Archangium sp.]|uniref:hypothetical protein n=1 Tax=Archangium sp. TaxID=1872627 RepID=UPI00389AE6C6
MTSKPPGILSVSASILALLAGAASSGLLVPSAEAQITQPVLRRRDEEEDTQELLLAVPPDGAQVILASHRSHRSHSSHSSHYSGHSSHSSHYSGGGSSGYSGGGSSGYSEPYVPPSPPKPATVSFVAYPGGRISVDGKPVGEDTTGRLNLAAGKHVVHVENRFLGSTTVEVELSEGQTGELKLEW